MKPVSLLCGAIPQREHRPAKRLPPHVTPRRMSLAARFRLKELLAERGHEVSIISIKHWSREEQGEAYLWAMGLGPLPRRLDGDAREVALRLHAVGAVVYVGVVAGWNAWQRLNALRWAEAFAAGHEDLPPPPHVYEATKAFP